jgi:hypothetical protein
VSLRCTRRARDRRDEAAPPAPVDRTAAPCVGSDSR